MNPLFLKTTFNTLLLTMLGLTLQAQKLKDVQETNMLAPANIKVDGKDTEWNDTFMAHNKSTNVFYTMSNDDKNLYLVIKSTDATTNAKIMAGGITLSINPDGKKKEKESITLTYPVINRPNFAGGGGGGMRRQAMGAVMSTGGGRMSDMSAKQRDSMMAEMQRKQLAQIKEIKINRFKNTTDTLVSIYNEYGIKAFASINKDNAFFYELAIPLEALGITKTQPTEFAYNVKLNGLVIPGLDGGGFGGGGFGGGRGQRGGSGIDFQAMLSPTDFWGKYTLK